MKDSETTTEERVVLTDVLDPAFLPINLFQFSVSALQFGVWGYDANIKNDFLRLIPSRRLPPTREGLLQAIESMAVSK